MADKTLPESHPQRRKPRKRPKRITPNKPTGIPCVDYQTVSEGAFTEAHLAFTGPDRRGQDTFWTQLAADLALARTRLTNWLRSKVADGIGWCAFKLLALAATVEPDA